MSQKYSDHRFHQEFYDEFMGFLKLWRKEVKDNVAHADIKKNQNEHGESIRAYAVWCWIARWLIIVDTPHKSDDFAEFELLQRAKLMEEDQNYLADLLLKDMRKWFTRILYDD